MLAADLFLAFDDKCQVAGQGSAGFQVGLDGLQMCEMLPLVVGGTARKKRVRRDARLERWGFPQLQRLGRLHVVMPIDHEMGARGSLLARGFGDHDRVTVGGANPGLQSDLFAMIGQPSGTGDHVAVMLRLGGDAGEPEKIT
jgi:hypothetical protein